MSSTPLTSGNNAAQAPVASSGAKEDFPKPLRFKSLLPAAIVALAALAMIPFAKYLDAKIGPFADSLPITTFSVATRQFSNTVAIVGMVLTIWLLDPKRRSSLAVLLVAYVLATGVNEGVKMAAGRARPHTINEKKRQGKQAPGPLDDSSANPIPTEFVDQWMWWRPVPGKRTSEYRSFPSGHTNAAFVLAGYLSTLYPQARAVWYVAAAGCGVGRVRGGRHYMTDVLFGGASGWLVAQLVLSWAWPMRLGKWLLRRTRLAKCSGS
jgi:membrane-associated phospholipid phosphatase